MTLHLHVNYTIDALPNSLINSTTNPNVKTTEGERVGIHSLTCSILKVKGCVQALGWGLG
jgi:hypothetical protein